MVNLYGFSVSDSFLGQLWEQEKESLATFCSQPSNEVAMHSQNVHVNGVPKYIFTWVQK